MPRLARFILPGVAVHIVQRGNNRADCFRRDGDYMLYLLHLRELAAAFDCAVHAYCLMTNHVHMLITPPSAQNCMALMRNLGQRYVQHFNRTYERTGTLWEGRYRSCVVESAQYVLACYRYIEHNPVRARMVVSASEYMWSSYRANTGTIAEPMITPHVEYLALSAERDSRHRAYAELFEINIEKPVLEGIRGATSGGYPLGSTEFRSRIQEDHGRRVERGRPGRPMKQRTVAQPKSPEIGL
jgi:REP-associated tyrosine transposase